MTRKMMIALLVGLLSCRRPGMVFSLQYTIKRVSSGIAKRELSVLWDSKLFGPDPNFDNEYQIREGEALAKQFYELQRKQGDAESTASGMVEGTMGDDSNTQTTRKFTGRPLDASFVGEASGVSSRAGLRSPRDQMMQREFELVGRAEKGLAFQAVLAVCVLILYLYVGLTGGIQSDRGELDLGADDTIIEELVIPERRDMEASYWL